MFLSQVCCGAGEQCCMKDQSNTFQPSYTCCNRPEQVCNYTDGKGSCEDAGLLDNSFPYAYQLDNYGRCPEDGGLPIFTRPNVVFRCSLSSLVQGLNSAATCPTGSYCAKDNSANQEEGVCCYDTTCGYADDCEECVKGTGLFFAGVGDPIEMDRPCSWLSQGDVLDQRPRCVRQCQDFPEQSCILPHPDARLCPRSVDFPNGTNYNTGTCRRRCGLVGTGRSDRINMDGNNPCVSDDAGNSFCDDRDLLLANATACCSEVQGDFCCNTLLQLADHCSFGRIPGGPMCGVPIAGQPSNFFNTAPYQIPNSAGAWQTNPNAPRPIPFRPPPMPFFGPGFYGGGPPMGMYGFPAMMNPFIMGMYGNFRSIDEAKSTLSKELTEEMDKQFFIPAAGTAMFRPLPPPRGPPPPPMVNQQPSAFICSCDQNCKLVNNADCCDDFFTLCDEDIDEATPEANRPLWWVQFDWDDVDF